MGNFTQQIQNAWSRFTISEAAREKLRNAWFSFLIGSVWIVGGLATLGPLDSKLTENLKNRTFGETYFVAKSQAQAVAGANGISEIRTNGESLAKWLENEGTEFVVSKKNGANDVYAVRKATADLRSAVTDVSGDKYDAGFYAYRIRASASAVPLEAFRANVATSGSWIFDRTLMFAFIGCLIVGLSSWLSAIKEKKAGLSRSLAIFSGFPGGLIGGAAVGFVTGIMTIGMFI